MAFEGTLKVGQSFFLKVLNKSSFHFPKHILHKGKANWGFREKKCPFDSYSWVGLCLGVVFRRTFYTMNSKLSLEIVSFFKTESWHDEVRADSERMW